MGHKAINTWLVEHGEPDAPNTPNFLSRSKLIAHGLYELDEPEPYSGKRFFLAIDPSVSRTYITDKEAEHYKNKK